MNHSNESLIRADLTKTENGYLQQMVDQCNDGFGGGKVTKVSLNAWIIRYYYENLFSKQIEKIREDHFDPIKHLEGLVQRMKKSKSSGTQVDFEKELSKLTSKARSSQKKSKPLLSV